MKFEHIVALCLVVAIFFMLAAPAFGVEQGIVDAASGDFFSWLYSKVLDASGGSNLREAIESQFSHQNEGDCPMNPMGTGHHWHADFAASLYSVGGVAIPCSCQYCGMTYREYTNTDFTGQDVLDAYDDYVDTLPATGVDDAGYLYWVPEHIGWACEISYGGSKYVATPYAGYTCGSNVPDFTWSENSDSMVVSLVVNSYWSYFSTQYRGNGRHLWRLSGEAPISGTYFVNGSFPVNERWVVSSGDVSTSTLVATVSYGVHVSQGDTYTFDFSNREKAFGEANVVSARVELVGRPVVRITPDLSIDSTTDTIYNINTRVTSIQGDYYYVEDGDVNIIENQTIVNETNNTVFNPVTNITYDMSGWQYDYSTRTYNITTNEGDTVTVNYGDEYVTINEGGNTYNINYYIDNSGNGGGGNGGEGGNGGGGSADTPSSSWWEDFKSWLGEKLDKITFWLKVIAGIETVDTVTDIVDDLNLDPDLDVEIGIGDGEGAQTVGILAIIGKFAFVWTIVEIGREFFAQIAANASGSPPNITVNLGAARSANGFNYGGEVVALDLSWYAEYKPTVDAIVGGFLWLLFLWALFKKAPGIISGASMDTSKVEDIDAGFKRKGRRG